MFFDHFLNLNAKAKVWSGFVLIWNHNPAEIKKSCPGVTLLRLKTKQKFFRRMWPGIKKYSCGTCTFSCSISSAMLHLFVCIDSLALLLLQLLSSLIKKEGIKKKWKFRINFDDAFIGRWMKWRAWWTPWLMWVGKRGRRSNCWRGGSMSWTSTKSSPTYSTLTCRPS